jgi:hypothetical protein
VILSLAALDCMAAAINGDTSRHPDYWQLPSAAEPPTMEVMRAANITID